VWQSWNIVIAREGLPAYRQAGFYKGGENNLLSSPFKKGRIKEGFLRIKIQIPKIQIPPTPL